METEYVLRELENTGVIEVSTSEEHEVEGNVTLISEVKLTDKFIRVLSQYLEAYFKERHPEYFNCAVCAAVENMVVLKDTSRHTALVFKILATKNITQDSFNDMLRAAGRIRDAGK